MPQFVDTTLRGKFPRQPAELELLDPSLGGMKLQIWRANIAFGVGTSGVNVNLPIPWSNSHDFTIASVEGAPGGGWGVPASAPQGLTQIAVYQYNNPVAQVITFVLYSYGR